MFILKQKLLLICICCSVFILSIPAAADNFLYGGVLYKNEDGSGSKTYVSMGEECTILQESSPTKVMYKGNEYYTNAEITQAEPQSASEEHHTSGNVIAHMGYSAKYPENSIIAFEGAGSMGYMGIETDVQMTADGVLVCFHDDTLDSVTTGSGKIRDKTWNELSDITYNTDATQKIATFNDYLDICKKYGCIAVIDIKYHPDMQNFCATILNAVAQKEMLNTAVFQCDMYEYLEEIHNNSSNARIWLLRHGMFEQNEVEYATKISAECMNSDTWDNDLVSSIHSSGMKTCYYTAETEEKRMEMQEMGIDYLMSDGWIANTTNNEISLS